MTHPSTHTPQPAAEQVDGMEMLIADHQNDEHATNPRCYRDGLAWPCDTIQALNVVDNLRAQLEAKEAEVGELYAERLDCMRQMYATDVEAARVRAKELEGDRCAECDAGDCHGHMCDGAERRCRSCLNTQLTAARQQIEELKRVIAEYENGITWETTCLDHAHNMDAAFHRHLELEAALALSERRRKEAGDAYRVTLLKIEEAATRPGSNDLSRLGEMYTLAVHALADLEANPQPTTTPSPSPTPPTGGGE